MKKIQLILFCTFIFSLLLTSCREEDEVYKDYAVQFKISATENVPIKSAVVQVGTEQAIDYEVNGQSWTSESQIISSESKFVRVASTGLAFDADSELIVQIYIDGVLAVADTATTTSGTANLVAETAIHFNGFQ